MATIPNGTPDAFTTPIAGPLLQPTGSVEPVGAAAARGSAEMPTTSGFRSRWFHRTGRRETAFAPVLADAFFASLGALLIYYVDFRASLGPLRSFHQACALLMLYTALTLLCCHTFGLYRERGHILRESTAFLRAIGLASLLFGVFVAWSGQPLSPAALLSMGAMNLGSFTLWRAWDRRQALRRVREGKVRNVLIVGANSCGEELSRSIACNPHWGFVVRGFVDDSPSCSGLLVKGSLDRLSEIARSEYIDDIFIVPPYERSLVLKLADEARRQHWNVKVLPEFWEPALVQPQVELLGELPVFTLHREPIAAAALLAKRAMDVMFVLCAAPIVLPLVGILALLVKLDSPGPAFYCADRIGRKGRKFCCWKLRTMVANADDLKQQLRKRNQRSGPFFKLSSDPRITRMGRLLRKSSLDELPQLWNVLRGDMSLVGPRPHPLDDYQYYDLEHRRRLQVRPGITGLWQVKARRDPSFETNMALDLAYIENWSLALDLKILLLTIPAVLQGTGE